MDILTLIFLFSLFMFTSFTFISQNPVHAVLSFVVVVLHVVVVLIIADLEFLAYILAIVYVGAILVLFLFVVMMFHLHAFKDARSILRTCIEFMALGSFTVYMVHPFGFYLDFCSYVNIPLLINTTPMTSTFAKNLFGEHLSLTVVAALLMLISILGPILLTTKNPKVIKGAPTTNKVRAQIIAALRKQK